MPVAQPELRPLERATLHDALVSRVKDLRAYLAQRLPPSLRATLAVDDILQEVWIAAHRAYPGFKPLVPNALDRWLITIAHSKLVDAVRAARRLKRGGDSRYTRAAGLPFTTFAAVLARLPARQRTPSRDLSSIELGHRLLIALQWLNVRQRQAIELCYFHGWTAAQIAVRLETTEKAVRDLLRRGLDLLRDVLGPAAKYFTDAPGAERPDDVAHAQP